MSIRTLVLGVCVCVCVCICMHPALRSFVAIVMLLHIYFWSTELRFSIAPENISSRIKVSLQGQCVDTGMFAILFAFLFYYRQTAAKFIFLHKINTPWSGC